MSESRTPRFVLLGGPNGSGKSTVAQDVVKGMWKIGRFLNADTIARGLSGFDPDLAMVAAGRVLLTEARRHIEAPHRLHLGDDPKWQYLRPLAQE